MFYLIVGLTTGLLTNIIMVCNGFPNHPHYSSIYLSIFLCLQNLLKRYNCFSIQISDTHQPFPCKLPFFKWADIVLALLTQNLFQQTTYNTLDRRKICKLFMSSFCHGLSKGNRANRRIFSGRNGEITNWVCQNSPFLPDWRTQTCGQ